jgi:SAM-dependent methyltransferase
MDGVASPVIKGQPWQLQMYEKSLKKKQKVAMLKRLLGHVSNERCLLISGHDNNGAMNFRFREAGGKWSWGQVYAEGIPEMADFLRDPVVQVDVAKFPFPDKAFDRVIIIDVHEHFSNLDPLNRELARITAPGGMVIVTTPNGNTKLPLAIFKNWIGMKPAVYGHIVLGYTVEQLEKMMRGAGLEPVGRGAYSKFFTEFAELVINVAYVKFLSKKKDHPDVAPGTIAPTSESELKAVEKTYRKYALIYPFMKLFSLLDWLIPFRGGYAVAVSAIKKS